MTFEDAVNRIQEATNLYRDRLRQAAAECVEQMKMEHEMLASEDVASLHERAKHVFVFGVTVPEVGGMSDVELLLDPRVFGPGNITPSGTQPRAKLSAGEYRVVTFVLRRKP